jgi:rifampicin phosphotransferase
MSELVQLNGDAGRNPVLVGHKLANLSRLRAAGFRTPAGFAVPTSVFARAGTTGDLPTAVRDEVSDAYRQLVARRPADPAVAVRSSGTDEDVPGRTAAGLYLTELDVVGPHAVHAAILRCWESARSDHLATYRGEPVRQAGLAVGVLEMIRPAWSGVTFSDDPLGSGRVVTEAVTGPLHPLVSGVVVPEHIETDRAGRPVRRWPGDHGAMLDADRLEALVALCLRVADEFGHPVDVEWAWDDDGVVLLQSRAAAT